MRAVQLVDTHTFELREVPTPDPGPGQVLVKVGGAGLCHSDLHLLHSPAPVPVPFTIGHETAGWVAAVGAGVEATAVGEAVLVHGAWGCGLCKPCSLGLEQHCRRTARAPGSGLSRDGGLAEYLLVPSARHLVPLGDLDPLTAAPLDDAALTPYRAVTQARHLLVPGASAVVIGIGGLGHMAVQLLAVLGAARTIAVDKDPEKLALAARLGADATVAPGEDAAAEIRELTGGVGASLVLDCVGVADTLALGAAVVGSMSRIVVVGVGMGVFPYSFLALPYETTIGNTFWGTTAELREVVALAQAGRITVVSERIDLDDVIATYARLESGGLCAARAVAAP